MKKAALILSLLLTACSRPLPTGVTELTYATPYSPQHPFSRADLSWIDYVEKRSGGKLRIKTYWSGSLLSSDMSMEELRHGIADIGLVTPIYVRGGTHLIRIQSGFYSGVKAVEAQVALYRCIAAANPQIGRELHGLHILAVQGGSLPGIVTRDRRIRSLADLKGLRLRAPSELLSVLEQLGVDAVNMPMADVYSAIAKGEIDGVIAPADTFKALHFAEIARFFNTLAVPRGAYPARAMNEAKWKRLTDEQRALLTESTAVWEAALAREVRSAVGAGFGEARKRGVQIDHMPKNQQDRFEALYLADAAGNAQRLRKLGIDGPAAFRTARSSLVGPDDIRCGGRS
ncbi:MAG: TRAP transporter substrate-binding protein DctP [Sphingobium sp.]|nr:TRAP transporter substrate-binding protein DctP [Sphingobium sp.]